MTIKKDNVYGYIYMIVNTVNDKPYIGKTVNINKRMNRHRYNARDGEKSHLYNAIRKYGEDNFVFLILEEAYSKEELNELEIYYIELYDTYRGFGYNQSAGGDGHGGGEESPMYGRKHTPEALEKISKTHKGKTITDEQRAKQSYSMRGKLKGESNPNAKLSPEDVEEIRRLLDTKEYTQKQIAEMFGVKQTAISRIKRGVSWS